MKKLLALLLAAVMCLSLVACGGGKEVVSGFDGTPALNTKFIDEHITRVELTTDNWKDYIKEYSYDVEVVEKDAFGEITNTEKVTVYRLGYGTEKYHCLSATIELKHKPTGEVVVLGQSLASNIVEDISVIQYEPIDLDEYECTRIKGYIYFIDYSEEVMDKVLKINDRWSATQPNATITTAGGSFNGTWYVDYEAKVIESNSDDWKQYFE